MQKSIQQMVIDYRKALNAMITLDKNTPRIIGNEAVKVVKDNFKLQGYDTGRGIKKWDERKASTNKAYDARRGSGQQGNYKGSVYSSTNPIMLQSRNLFNGVKFQVINRSVLIGEDLTIVPYAKFANEKRQYIPKPTQPPNPKILSAINKKITFERDKAMKDFKK